MAAEDVVEVVEEVVVVVVVVAEEVAPDRSNIAGHMEIRTAAILVHNAWHSPQVIKMQLRYKIEWAVVQTIAMNDGVGLKVLIIKLVK